MPAGASSCAPMMLTVALSAASFIPHHAEPAMVRHVLTHVQHHQQLPALLATLHLTHKLFWTGSTPRCYSPITTRPSIPLYLSSRKLLGTRLRPHSPTPPLIYDVTRLRPHFLMLSRSYAVTFFTILARQSTRLRAVAG